MRLLLSVLLPLSVQLLGFGLVITISRVSSSFVGLLALSLAVLALPLITLVNWFRAPRVPPATVGRLLVTGLLVALTWPVLLLLLRAFEPSLGTTVFGRPGQRCPAPWFVAAGPQRSEAGST